MTRGPKICVAVDFTHPSSIYSYGKVYYYINIIFLVITNYGYHEKNINDVNKDNQSFSVSPNMSKHIVALQEGLEDISRTFPATFVLHK